MKVTKLEIEDILLIEPDIFEDNRGFFMEIYNHHHYERLPGNHIYVQDNLSFSKKNILRGLHFQRKHPQAKLIQVISGEIFDVAVDLRRGAPTFGRWVGANLSDKNCYQLFIPQGFAHGFCVLSETAHVLYKCTDIYDPDDDKGILWSDPDINIDWPVTNPILSDKDKKLLTLSSFKSNQLPAIDTFK